MLPEDGRNYRPKHVELIEITIKLLLLHLVRFLYYCISDARSQKHQICSLLSNSADKFQSKLNAYVKCDLKSKLPIHCHRQMSQQQQQQQRQVPFNIFLDIFKTEIQGATPR